VARNVSAAIANPIRTGVQLVPSAVITEFIDAFVYDMSEKQYLALAALLLLVVSFTQNAVENYQKRGFLRQVPPTNVPVIDDER
jgi:glucose uptake protein GlcU